MNLAGLRGGPDGSAIELEVRDIQISAARRAFEVES
jgi:hypothetical protein